MKKYYIYEYGSQKIIKVFKDNKKACLYYDSLDKSKYGFIYKYHFKKSLYKEVYKNILDGYSYSDGFHGFKAFYRNNDSMIIYNHYGSSAVELSYNYIVWLLENIFMDDFYKLKLTKNGYVNMI